MWDFAKFVSKNLVLNKYFWDFAYVWVCTNFMNVFINFVKKSLVRERIRVGIKALKKVEILLLPVLNIFI